MQRPLLGILVLVWFLLLYITSLYYFDIHINVGEVYQTRVPDLEAFFSETKPETVTKEQAKVDKVAVKNAAVSKPDSQLVTILKDTLYPFLDSSSKVDTSTQRVLLIGDSMAEALYFAFQKYCNWSHYPFKLVAIRGTSSPFWASNDTLVQSIRKFKPSLILFTLGANEITVPSLMSRKRLYSKIIKRMDSIPYIWVGTPVWTKDTVYRKMIRSIVPEDQFFDSQDIVLERQKDGAHPTFPAWKVWADSIAHWMVYHSKYPVYFQLRQPTNWQKKKRIIDLPDEKLTRTYDSIHSRPDSLKPKAIKKKKIVLPDTSAKP